MTHETKLKYMRLALTSILFAIVLWIVWQLVITTTAAAEREEREQWCFTQEDVSQYYCFEQRYDERFETRAD